MATAAAFGTAQGGHGVAEVSGWTSVAQQGPDIVTEVLVRSLPPAPTAPLIADVCPRPNGHIGALMIAGGCLAAPTHYSGDDTLGAGILRASPRTTTPRELCLQVGGLLVYITDNEGLALKTAVNSLKWTFNSAR
jgi:hypothetical protein